MHFSFLHLLVICATRTLSDEKCSSRSNKSKAGGGRSRKAGGNICEIVTVTHEVGNQDGR